MEIKLNISEDVSNVISERGIKEEDIQQVISETESTDNKLHNPENNHFLAKKKIDEFTVNVEYSKTEENYIIHTAYGHRTSVVSDNL